MSKQNEREISFAKSSGSQNKDNYNQDNTQQNEQQPFNRYAEESKQSLNQSLDETKRNLHKNIDDAKSQIPRYAQTFTDAQEQVIQATQDIADNYIEYQKQAINSLQSIFDKCFESGNNPNWNNKEYLRNIPEIYSKITSSYAENTIAVNRMFNDLLCANIETFKNLVNNTKEHSKHLSEIGKRNAKTYEGLIHYNGNKISQTSQNR